ncbi:zinc-dependent alcohol dehydrogenase [Nakamurella lactea]|uniref:zinc-dependent alcohol dehydrogenase n=1 Tax=Nakamurella lactea TaxID=459515 RepID=UPI00042A7CFB|nr:zinc-binding alcohol dehydrogenase [Nakamurella lactea]
MPAFRLTGPRATELVEQPVPPIGAGQLLVRARYTAVSAGTEVRMYRGEEHVPQNPQEYPMASGYSMVGTVEQVGRDVVGFDPGDRVFVLEPHQSWAVVDAGNAFRLPTGADDQRFAYALVAEIALHALRRCSPTFGESAAVFGQGVVGLAGIAVARAWGLRTIALDLAADRLELSTRIGADLAVLADSADVAAAVNDFAGPAGVDLALESASSWQAVRQAYQLLRRGGRLCVVSRHTSVAGINLLEGDLMTKEITLTSGYAHPVTDVPLDLARWTRPRNLALIIDRIAAGRLSLDEMVTHRIRPDQLPDIYARLDRGDTSISGVIVDWT